MTNLQENHKSHYLAGHWITGNGHPFFSVNPADASTVWQGHCATREEVMAACNAAHYALPGWSSETFQTRCHYILNFAKEIETRKTELAFLIALETGKPLWEALTEVNGVIAKAQLSIQAYEERVVEKHFTAAEAIARLTYKPHGVIAILGAFNFPAHLSNGHIIPALLAGNTLVYKPSELTPAVAEFITQCWHESGLPAGVMNCLQGDAQTGQFLMEADIQGVYFTGSYRTGKRINQYFSDKPEVILALEMGGNNPLVLGKTAHLEAAVYHALLSTMITAGQRCTCARRLIIPRNKTGDAFLQHYLTQLKKIKIGAFSEKPEPFMGPVIRYEQALTHLASQQQLLDSGASPLLTMRSLKEQTGFLSPGVVDMTAVKTPFDEEIFAPFVQVYRYESFEEALFLANQTRYGLAAGLLSEEVTEYEQFYKTIRAGLINWNRPTTGAVSTLPFGGVGLSGNHRPSAYFAADYCSYPIASMEECELTLPALQLPGITLD
ncbi:MAG: succinylglutamate-semialdehyde dehydrogenase [Tatlockia sp.]